VKIGGNAATGVTVVSSTSITATTPSGTAGAKDVVVTNPDAQSGILMSGFTYVATDAILSVPAFSNLSLGLMIAGLATLIMLFTVRKLRRSQR
jgi:hypothetical protein